jgi:DNA-binding XRE family transcriptional regulator
VCFNFPPQKIYNRYSRLSQQEDFILVDAFTFGKGKGDDYFRSFYTTPTAASDSFRVLCVNDLSTSAEFIQTMSKLQGEFDERFLCRYVFDSLTGMQELWGEKETLNFFTYTCPKLYELKALAYWPLAGEAHSRAFLANIGHITQLVIRLSFQEEGTCAAKFLKVEGRPSHLLNDTHTYGFQDHKIAFLNRIGQSGNGGQGTAGRDAAYEEPAPIADFIRNEYPIKIGGRIREFRKERNLSQVDLARALKITPSALSQIENSLTLPSLQLFVDIARFFGTSLDSFFSSPAKSNKS